jgi:hypothetical protein
MGSISRLVILRVRRICGESLILLILPKAG